MSFWTYLWARLKAVPVGVYAALGAALALFALYARGRRLEAELAAAKLNTDLANASAASAASEAAAKVHKEAADVHAQRVEVLETHAATLNAVSKEEQKRLAALPPDQITSEFLKLAKQKRVIR